ncbi:MAG: methyltransferase domain-containing protein [Polyangiales bacterium]
MNTPDRGPSSLAASLSSDDALLPFVPKLLRDLWWLGVAPDPAIALLRRNLAGVDNPHALDFGCGKGALLIRLAEELGWSGRGIDIVPAFIEEARRIASEHGVGSCLRFDVRDMAHAVEDSAPADLVCFGFDSDALGPLETALNRMRRCLEPTTGCLLLDTAWVRQGPAHDDLATEDETLEAAHRAGYQVKDRTLLDAAWVREQNDANTERIRRRARELARDYPAHAPAFARYVREQEDESRLLSEQAVCALLLFTLR